MIAFLHGDIVDRNDSSVIIDVNGVGYEVFVPNNVLGALERNPMDVKLYTYMQVKEDLTALFGFLNKQDLRTFKLLITVNGIGPKGALQIMSYMTTEQLILAVLADDAKTISKAPGIGAKTASKLVLELKDKFSLEDTLHLDRGTFSDTSEDSDEVGSKLDDSVRKEAVEALTALGYSASQALRAVKTVTPVPDMTVEQLLKESLKYIG